MEPNGILIYAELTNDFNVKTVVKELVTKALELKAKIWNQRIMACVIGPRIQYDSITEELGKYGADEVIIVSDDRLKNYNTTYYGEIFTSIAKKYPPRIVLIGATVQGKEIASYASAKLDTGLTADCTDLNINDTNLLVSTRPTFGGQLTADIVCKTFPQMATVQEHTFIAQQNWQNANAKFDWFDIDKIKNKITLEKTTEKVNSRKNLSTSKIIVAGGAGACKNDGFALIYQLAQKLGAAVGGSREAYERGYITKSQQIGQTGTAIAPDLYIAVGISGANQHTVSINNSKKIIAINNDPNAPIFKYADIGITGDLFKVLPELIEKLN